MRTAITKKEWTRVVGANLALLLLVYLIALITTLCGSDFFLLKVDGGAIAALEDTLRSWNVNFLVPLAFASIEETIILCFVCLSKPKFWWPLSYFAMYLAFYFVFAFTINSIPGWLPFALGFPYAVAIGLVSARKDFKHWWKPMVRLLIAAAASIVLNFMIFFFRTKLISLGTILSSTSLFYLSVEYDLALSLVLGFIALLMTREKGVSKCQMHRVAGGSSPTSTKCSPKPLPKRNDQLPPSLLKKAKRIRAMAFAAQTAALIAISLFPIIVGKGTEFAIMYVSFCLTRLILGFKKSLHFKSEMLCISAGALVFWGLTLLIPSHEAILIVSVAYGCGLALGFRLYWELHDLRLYRLAAKSDRKAMLYCAFKGNIEPRHIKGIMKIRGYGDREIRMVVSYMSGLKIEAIAHDEKYAKITIDKALTEIAEDLYSRR